MRGATEPARRRSCAKFASSFGWSIHEPVQRRAMSEARRFAIAAHGEQKYGTRPYVVHLDDVATIVAGLECGETASTIAYLHDVLEDTEVKPEEIEGRFGVFVRECVELLTDPPAQTRQERKQALH